MTVEFVKVNHKIINRNGWSIWLPGKVIKGLDNFSEPDVHAESSRQLYPLGTKLEFSDGRVFRYCKASSAGLGYTARCMANGWGVPENGVDGALGTLHVTATAGDDQVYIHDAASAADRPVNYYEGGLFCYTPAGGQYITYRICGSEVGDTHSVLLYLDSPIRVTLALNSREARAHPSIYGKIIGGNTSQQWKSFVCANQIAVSASGFFWGQTKGPCHLVNFGEGANECGGLISERDVWSPETDGSIDPYTRTAAITLGAQRVGYVLEVTSSTVGECLIMLMLE